jgi:hypothetical protein
MPAGANAASLTDLLGINDSIDRTIHGMQAIVDQARDAALAIEAQTNQDVTARLSQINAIIDKTVVDVKAIESRIFADTNQLVIQVNALLSDRLSDIGSLEKQFVNDLAVMIDKAECAVDLSLSQALKDALGGIGKFLGSNRIEITPPIMYAGEHTDFCVSAIQNCEISRIFTIKTPFSTTYFEIRDYFIGRLNGVRDDTPIQSIVTTYQYLAALAKRTGCFMRGSETSYDEEFIYYISKARQWNIVTSRRRS